jgi:FkbM family methyltransferase
MNYSNPTLIALRTFGQNLGVLRPLVRIYRWLINGSYEDKFDREMLAHIELGETVWDVGANIGFYTQKFAECVGSKGFVVAFEPSPKTFKLLKENTSSLANVNCENLGLSNSNGQVFFSESLVEADPTNKIVLDNVLNARKIEVTTGDLYSKANSVPNAIKIDVESFEIEVIAGMSNLLLNSNLKKLFVEVHFLEMKKRGFKNGSTQIIQAIKAAGFSVKWIDSSHFIAIR